MNARGATVQGVVLALSCLAGYSLVTDVLAGVHSLSRADDLIGGLWAVVATVFVLRATHAESVQAARSRAAATVISFGFCFAYLLFLPFHPWGLAVVIGVETLVLTAIGNASHVPVAGITTAVVMVAAALSPREAWQQPLLRLGDTTVGIAVGLGASWLLAVGTTVVQGRGRRRLPV